MSTRGNDMSAQLAAAPSVSAGDIGVAESSDGGATWSYLGIALDEPWHLSYPFVFQWKGEVGEGLQLCGLGGLRGAAIGEAVDPWA